MSNLFNLKHALITLTVISVVADTMILPFYPQFFNIAFGINSPMHVGYYIAACCFTVMSAFPLWAKVARYIHELHLWVYTQIAAAILGLYCYFTTSIVEFWIASQLMLIFKASYLLIYPFVMRLEEKDKHLGVASLFAVLMHFGGIGGAIIGGYVLNWFTAKDLYLVMPLSDIIQVAICWYLIRTLKIPLRATAVTNTNKHSIMTSGFSLSSYVWKLCVVSAMFYFSAFLIRPFFTRYWEIVSGWNNAFAIGIIYSIPAWVALICLWYSHGKTSRLSDINAILAASFVGLAGLFVQGSGEFYSVITGRILFGYAFFQISVRLEVLLFSISCPERYAADFSKIHFFQNIGVIGSSFCVGYLVSDFSLTAPFTAAAGGLFVSLVCFYFLFSASRNPAYIEKPAPMET